MRAWRNVLLTFGMVNIPVSLAPLKGAAAVESHRYGPGGERVKMVPTIDGETILSPGDVTTRYLTPSGEAVEIDKPELPGENGIGIAALVPAASIDPLFYESAYALWAGKGGDRSFAALAHALEDRPGAALVGVARFTDRPRDVLIRYSAETDSLILHTLSFPASLKLDEATETAAKLPAPDPADLSAAETFLDGLPATFTPTEADPMDSAILAALEAALPAAMVSPAPADPAAAPDLLASLRAAGIE